MQISTARNDDPVTVHATDRTLPGGLNHVQFATVQVPSQGVTVNIHNDDDVPNQ